MSEKSEIQIEVAFVRRFNLGNFNHKEMSIKLSGTEEQINQQIGEKKATVINYLSELAEIVEIAQQANGLKNTLVESEKANV